MREFVREKLAAELDVAEAKAWDALGRYKFQMFGYWAAIWVHLNRIGEFHRPNPWAGLVQVARGRERLTAAAEKIDQRPMLQMGEDLRT